KGGPWASRWWRTSRARRPGLCAAPSAGRLLGAMEPWKLVASLALTASALAGQGKRAIAVGDTVRDSLTRHDALLPAESTYAKQWRLAGTAGKTVTIDGAADAFDRYAF